MYVPLPQKYAQKSRQFQTNYCQGYFNVQLWQQQELQAKISLAVAATYVLRILS